MKKLFYSLILAFMAFTTNAQTVISNGEDTGIDWWQAGSTAVEIVDWHPKEGNPSAKCMTIWISTNSDAWSGGGLSGLDIDVTTNNKISVLVYKNVAGTVRLELQDGINNPFFITANFTTPGAWQKLNFTIPAEMTNNIKTILIAPFIDYDLSTIAGEESRCFWDEVIAYKEVSTGVNSFDESQVKIFMNNSKSLIIQGLTKGNSKISVYDIQGKLGKSYTVNGGDELILNGLESFSSGLYIVKVENGNSSFAKKIMIR